MNPPLAMTLRCILCAVLGGCIGAWAARLTFVDQPAGISPSAPQAAAAPGLEDVKRRLDALESRLAVIGEQVRESSPRTEREPVKQSGEDLGQLPPEALAERLRQPVLQIIEEARHEQAWLKQLADLYGKACSLTHMGMVDYMGDDARDELKTFLADEFKPYWERHARFENVGAGAKLNPEEVEALKDARRAFYARLSGRYPQDFADRIFVTTVVGWGDSEDPAVVHKLVLDVLK